MTNRKVPQTEEDRVSVPEVGVRCSSDVERIIIPEVLLALKCSHLYLLECYKLAGMEMPRSEVSNRRVSVT